MIPKLHIMSQDEVKSLYTRIDDTFTSRNGKYVFRLFLNDDDEGTGSFRVELDGEDEVLTKLSNAVPKWFIREKEKEAELAKPASIDVLLPNPIAPIDIVLEDTTSINFVFRNSEGNALADIEYEVIVSDGDAISYETSTGEGETVVLTGEDLIEDATVTIRAFDYPSVSVTFTVSVIAE
jgi:hypothetical protein